MDRAAHAKHWARTGMQFVILGEGDEAQRCLDASGAQLRSVTDSESIEVLECELQLWCAAWPRCAACPQCAARPRCSARARLPCLPLGSPRRPLTNDPYPRIVRARRSGYRAHLAWTRGDLRQVLRHVEEAHAMLEARGGTQLQHFASSRMYLSDQVAFRLARKGFEISEAGGGAPNDKGEGGIERRQLIRLLDLALSFLGGSAPSAADAQEEVRCLQLRTGTGTGRVGGSYPLVPHTRLSVG